MDANFNPDKQHTLGSITNISGTGLHTGIKVDMTLKPANPGFGLQFQRVDLPGQPVIKADCDLVTDTSRGTTLEDNGAKVSTVEHILAALVGMGIDNCLIEINGPEIPIIDGSSMPFVEIIEDAGVAEQDAAKVWYTIDTNISHYDEKKRVEMVVMPAMEYKVTTLIDFNSPVLGTQHAGLKSMREFKAEIAPCRTFCFLHELEMLLEHNLVKGGDINNAIVIVDKPVTPEEMERLAKAFQRDKIEVKSGGYLNNLELRFPNEPARHKLLDVIGDRPLSASPSRDISSLTAQDIRPTSNLPKRSSSTSKRTSTSRIPPYTTRTSRRYTRSHRSKKPCPTAFPSCWWTRSSSCPTVRSSESRT
ncbi:UDP-3-O-acyl-N-acetylglucosamine deacetylase [Puia sp. P3]|uniref:UDP-3-O-acyl-N-acetylglucosamine deacetylase n=1 Tax=Puia sp. P3 TaxID=3423952 RepID=UPI003D67DF90